MVSYSWTSKISILMVIGVGITCLEICLLEQICLGPNLDMLVFLVFMLLCSGEAIQIPGTKGRISPSEAFIFTSLLLFGPHVAPIVAALDGIVSSFRISRSLHKIAFNTASSVASTMLSGKIFVLALLFLLPPGTKVQFPLASLPLTILLAPLWTLALTQFLASSLLVSSAIALTINHPILAFWRKHFMWSSLTCFVGAGAAPIVAHMFRSLGSASILMLAPVIILVRVINRVYLSKVNESHRLVQELADLHLSTVSALAMAIDAKDQITHGHVCRVQVYAIELAEAAGLKDPKQKDAIRSAALLHDIGKLAVPEYVLNKPGRLTRLEFECIKQHAEIGAQILRNVKFPYPVVPIVLHHHEYYDGSGYPSGLKSTEIPVGARILAIADGYDAMRSDRPYRPGMTQEETITEMQRCNHYDPVLLEAFIKILPSVDKKTREMKLDTIQLETFQKTTDQANQQLPLQSTGNPSALQTISSSQHELYTLFELCQTLTSTLDIKELLSLVLIKIQRLIPIETGSIMLYEEDSGILKIEAVWGSHARKLMGKYMLVSEGVSGWALINEQPVINGSATGDLRALGIDTEKESGAFALVYPLTFKGEKLGCLTLYSAPSHPFDDNTCRLVEHTAPHVASAVKNALLFARSQKSAFTDALTGLPNLRMLFIIGRRILESAVEDNNPIVLLMMDLDYFKAVNDDLGHSAGDEVLIHVGQLLTSCLRKSDKVFRYAGDEFIAILPGCSSDDLVSIQSRINCEFRKYRFLDEHSRTARIGISIGAANFPDDGSTIEELMKIADRRMYENKAANKEWLVTSSVLLKENTCKHPLKILPSSKPAVM